MDNLGGESPVRLAGGNVLTAHDWDVAAAAVLRRGRRLAEDAPDEGAWDALAGTTVEGLVIPPLGTPERAASRSSVLAPAAPAGRVDTGWDIRSLVTDPDPETAASSALADLENGATSLWVTIGGSGTTPADLARALDGVFVEMAPIVISPAGATTDLEAARALADVLAARGVPANPGSSLGADPIGRAVRSGDPAGTLDVSEIASLATTLGVRALVADGTAAHEAGAGDAAELGYALAVGTAYLRALEATGVSIDDALSLLEFRFAATDDQFVTIAKFRAARGLWSRVAELSGGAAAAQVQHAVTSLPMLTRYDPWVNLLRTTVAAFAAGVGGADAVTVLPFDTRLGIPDALGRRMARNTSSLLINESHVAAVTDPAGGSHAVEILTTELAEAGWAEFQRIERSGGIGAALADGSLRSRWAVTAAERARRIATRRQPITGVSEFPNLREVLPTRRSATMPETGFWADAFEDMRDTPATAPVFLATLGTVPEHAARAGFVANLFAAGGVESVTAGATGSVADVITAFGETGSPVVCLAGSDKAYAESGAAVVEGLRAAGATWVVLAGRPKGQLADLVDDHVAVGEDVVEFLRRTRTQLGSAATKEATR